MVVMGMCISMYKGVGECGSDVEQHRLCGVWPLWPFSEFESRGRTGWCTRSSCQAPWRGEAHHTEARTVCRSHSPQTCHC